jgi:hypothetical protein
LKRRSPEKGIDGTVNVADCIVAFGGLEPGMRILRVIPGDLVEHGKRPRAVVRVYAFHGLIQEVFGGRRAGKREDKALDGDETSDVGVPDAPFR